MVSARRMSHQRRRSHPPIPARTPPATKRQIAPKNPWKNVPMENSPLVRSDGVRQEDEPPKAEEPSPDSREDAASDEEADRAEEPLEERADGELAARRVPHRSRDEAEHSPQDHRDAQDGEAGPRDQGGRRAPAQGEAP